MSRSTQAIKQQYQAAVFAASRAALILVEAQARAILRRHPALDEFVMGMGMWFFTYKVGARDRCGIRLTADMNRCLHEPRAYMRPLLDILDELNDDLKLTGEPMRFTAEGPVIHDWGVQNRLAA
jgi:hypothetical protein